MNQPAAKGQTLRQLAENFKPRHWQAASWQAVDGERRTTRLAWKPIYLNSDLNEKTGHWPSCWLVAVWPAGQADPYHLYIAWLKQPPVKGRLLRLSRGRWPIEQYFQRGKDDLGLDHYEGQRLARVPPPPDDVPVNLALPSGSISVIEAVGLANPDEGQTDDQGHCGQAAVNRG